MFHGRVKRLVIGVVQQAKISCRFKHLSFVQVQQTLSSLSSYVLFLDRFWFITILPKILEPKQSSFVKT